MAGGRSSAASLITTLLVTLIIVVPLVWLILMLRVEAIAAYAEVQAFLAIKPCCRRRFATCRGSARRRRTSCNQLSADPNGDCASSSC